ncbi:C40 family peptidase [Blautia faecis]|uniref:C40 family peptidase n=1 Tax=Blautia faecis TaxID=871665 RepID=UPI00165647F4|nr:C40 family peptidase [Blautia faecis]MBC8612737.1 C40 family peptidase [Blautia faecis]
MKKRIVCLTLAILMCGSQAVSVMADRESDLREEQAWTSQQLDAIYARMSALWDQKQQLESQIESLNSDLVNVMVSIQTLENDIASKEAEIEKTQGDLTKAQNAKDKQYSAMKKRIQYLYEKGGNNAWFQMMLNADNLADLLTRAEYTQQMYEQDRESLQKYARTIEEVQKLEEQYEQEKADFETMKEEYEAQQSNLQYQLDVTRANSADCENEIAYAQQQATEYANLLEQQQAEIEQLEAERIAAEEEARRQAEAEAAAAAAAQEAAQNGDNSSEDVQYDEDGNVVSGSSDGSSDYEYDEYGNVIDTDNTVDYNSDASSSGSSSDSSSDSSSASSSSGSGSSVVSYATQFVGNPYVWGGTSLTSGADCSGFVQSVYANFGVSLPRTSYEQQNAGYEVSYADAQPGDLICYGGHVAIYMGNGQIVHASNARDGIKVSDNAAYRTITSVRRLV